VDMRNAGYKYACEDSNWLRRQQQEGAALSYSAGPIDYACTPQLSQQVQPPQCPAELQDHLSIAFTRCF
jgi:hypothetical protein